MKISEMIKALEKIMENEGDLRVTIYDDYTEAEGWDFEKEDLWLDAEPIVDEVINGDEEVLEKVVLIR